jgi:hypothetical protein
MSFSSNSANNEAINQTQIKGTITECALQIPAKWFFSKLFPLYRNNASCICVDMLCRTNELKG